MKRRELLSVLGASAFAAAAGAAADAETIVRVGDTATDAFAEGFYAVNRGFYKDAGINVEITPFSTGAAIATGVASGTIDVGVSNISLLVQAIARGTPFVFIAGSGVYSAQRPITGLAVLSNAPLHAAHDFPGKTIAVAAIADLTQLSVYAWLTKAGVDPKSVHFIEIPFTEMTAALSSGLADAAVLVEPYLSVAVRNGTARVAAWPYSSIAPSFMIGAWFTTKQWHLSNRDLCKRFAAVIYQTATWANGHESETAQLLSSIAKIPQDTTRSMTRSLYATMLDPASIQPQLDLAYDFHAIDRPLKAADLIAK